MTNVYFVRHGESVSNLMTQFAGSLDMPLTEKGEEQAASTAAYLEKVPFTVVYASDLSRAYATGLAVAQMHNVPIFATDQLREIDAGDWEGKQYSRLEEEYSDSYGVWRSRIGLAECPNGETVAQLQARIRTGVEEIVRKHPGETICIATHATPIRVMECVWMNIPLARMHTIPWVSNASVTIAEYTDDGIGKLIARDLHEHLGNLHTVLAKNV
jgi:broad specificity phosphatase PhoE